MHTTELHVPTDDLTMSSRKTISAAALALALGWITPIWAAIGMSISSLTVVLNALRLTRMPHQAHTPVMPHTRPLPV